MLGGIFRFAISIFIAYNKIKKKMPILTFIYANYFYIVALISVWNNHRDKQVLLGQVLHPWNRVKKLDFILIGMDVCIN